jgi:ubiquinone/menaquinone biosynthesis C-methylase UbiE
MTDSREDAVAAHYSAGGLGERILAGLRQAGIDPAAVRAADLAPVDEFHMGGRDATQYIVGLMHLSPGMHVLDIGSGLGGLARYLAGECGCRATGIDLTPEFVQVAGMLTQLTGLSDRVDFQAGSALDMPWPAGSFDAAVTFHVAMNIADRPRLYAEAARVLRSGAPFAVYDVLKGPTEGMLFPTPWAATAATSHLVTAAEMRALLDDAGFDITHQEDRKDVGLAYHRDRLAATRAAGGPPPLGPHLILGKIAGGTAINMLHMLESNQITLQAILARRR